MERASKKGTGELEGVTYEEITYEGYGPGGVAILVETMTDNKNRTVSEIRHMFQKGNGNMGETGCVSWMFTKRGLITIPKEGTDEEQLMEKALEVGAEDVQDGGDIFEVQSAPGDVNKVAEDLREAGFKVESSEVAMVPKNTVSVEGRDAEVLVRLMGLLEDHDDVQHVWANADIDDAVLEQLAE